MSYKTEFKKLHRKLGHNKLFLEEKLEAAKALEVRNEKLEEELTRELITVEAIWIEMNGIELELRERQY